VVTGDDRFQGQAVLLVPGNGRIVGSGSGSACDGCEWSLVPDCQGDAAPENPAGDGLCTRATATCGEPGSVRYRVYFRSGRDTAFRVVDVVCLGGGQQPVTAAQLAAALREPFEKLVPPQRPGYQPGNGALVQLPTIFYAGQPTSVRGSVDVLGFRVGIEATPMWTWAFERGVAQDFAVPGAPWPNKDVTYTYTTTGARQVSVVTTWRGRFTVDGAGPYEIAEPVVQRSAPLAVPVVQARSQLVQGTTG
jgi:hypothetical protein